MAGLAWRPKGPRPAHPGLGLQTMSETGEARAGMASGAGAGHLAHRQRGEAGCGSRRSPVRWCGDLNQRRGGGAYQPLRSTAARVEQRRSTTADRTRGGEHH
jgi:hypothetical protein